MYQSDRGNYKKEESIVHMASHSCLGKIIIASLVVVVLLIIACITTPSVQTMQDEMMDNIVQCIQDNDSIKTDKIDDAIHNVGYIFTRADSLVDPSTIEAFHKYNKLESYEHTFLSTSYIYNNIKPEGVRVGFGLFGFVIPTVNYTDLLLRTGPMHKGYGVKIRTKVKEEYFGENPSIQEFHYKRDPRE